jgi:hypothetical protein
VHCVVAPPGVGVCAGEGPSGEGTRGTALAPGGATLNFIT